MCIQYFQVDAFAESVFGGNPAGVCMLEKWLPDDLLQHIAAENNLSETAFLIRQNGFFDLRWFTPVQEVDLCGHATLAPAFVLFSELGHSGEEIRFQSRSGFLIARRRGEIIELDFPSRLPTACTVPDELIRGLGAKPREVLRSRDYFAVFDSQAEVAALAPDMSLLARLEALGIIVTSRGKDADFVSRFFAPRAGIPEDPATGSSHCSLIPFWAERLGKQELFARQISPRGGQMYCRQLGERVGIGGRAVIYSRAELNVPV